MFKYEISTYDNGGRGSVGRLKWDADSYDVVSGPYGLGTLPLGRYEVRKNNVVNNPGMDDPYCITDASGARLCWFIPLQPKFTTSRTGFGIHPDGNVPGSEGCVVVRPSEVEAFWRKWMRTSMAERPSELEVVDAPSKGKGRVQKAKGTGKH